MKRFGLRGLTFRASDSVRVLYDKTGIGKAA